MVVKLPSKDWAVLVLPAGPFETETGGDWLPQGWLQGISDYINVSSSKMAPIPRLGFEILRVGKSASAC